MKPIYATLTILSILLIYLACKKNNAQHPKTFFANPRYDNDFCLMASKLSPDAAVKFIHDETPPKWYGIACESTYYNFKEDTPDSIRFRYFDLCEQWFPHDTVLVFTQGLRGQLLFRKDQYDTAMICLKKAYQLSIEINSAARKADVLAYMGQFYSRQSNYPEAIKALLEANQIFISLPSSIEDGRLFENLIDLGNAYRNSNDYIAAQIWGQRAWQFTIDHHSGYGYRIHSAAAIAENYLHLNQLDSAKIMIDTSFYYQNISHIIYNEASRYYILAQILLAQGFPKQALSNFWEAKRRNRQTIDIVNVNRYNQGLGDAYLSLGQLDSALWFYRTALTTTDTVHQAVIYKQLAKIYTQNRRYDLAYQAEQKSRRLSDNVFTIEKNKTIGQLQAKYELDRREWHLMEIENKSKSMYLSMIIGLLTLTLAFIISLYWFYQKKRELIQEKQARKLLIQEKELSALREQVHTKKLFEVQQVLNMKDLALKESTMQVALKDLLIQELTLNNQQMERSLQNQELQNLRILTNEDWRKFRSIFDQRFPNFIADLLERFPKLSVAEIRLLTLIRIGFDAIETANILGISSSSIYKNRYRLRKKIGLSEDDDLDLFVLRFNS